MNEDLEQRLSRQSFRSIPDDWKQQILTGAEQAFPVAEQPSVPRSPWRWVHDLLWPSPIAWAALAAVWIGIGVMNQQALQLAEDSGANSHPVTREMMIVFHEQSRWIQSMLEEEQWSGPWDRPRLQPADSRSPNLPLLLMTS